MSQNNFFKYCNLVQFESVQILSQNRKYFSFQGIEILIWFEGYTKKLSETQVYPLVVWLRLQWWSFWNISSKFSCESFLRPHEDSTFAGTHQYSMFNWSQYALNRRSWKPAGAFRSAVVRMSLTLRIVSSLKSISTAGRGLLLPKKQFKSLN